MEDILEEIVGEILDESDQEEIKLKEISNKEFILDCSLDFDRVKERFDLLAGENADTFSGFIYQLFGRIPREKDSTVYKGKYKFTVEELDEQRIKSVHLKILS